MTGEGEFYVCLIPCAQSDHERIFRTRTGPHQRIKVSRNSRLTAIAHYIQNLISPPNRHPTRVELYTVAGSERLSVPLCLTVGELYYMTNQQGDGELYYSLIDGNSEERERPSSPVCAPSAPVFHSGLSMLSNSFGMALPGIDSDSFGVGRAEETSGETVVDLKANLEKLLQGQTI
jgi:hypothetical protein